MSNRAFKHTHEIDTYLETLTESHQFSGSILIGREGEILYKKGCNLGNINPEPIARNLAAIVFNESCTKPEAHRPVQLPPKTLAACQGQYQFAPGITLTVTHEKDHLTLTSSGGAKTTFYPESETQFFQKGNQDTLTFHKNNHAEITHLTLKHEGIDTQATRVTQ